MSYNTKDCTGTGQAFNVSTNVCFSSNSGYFVRSNCTDSTTPPITQKPASDGSFVSLCAAAFAGAAAISLSML